MHKHGGISRYFCGLARALSMDSNNKIKIISPFYINEYLGELPKILVYGTKIPALPKTGRLLKAYNSLLSRTYIDHFAPNVVHETYYSPSTYAPLKSSRTITVFDMIHELFPEMFPKNDPTSKWKHISTERADHIFCISENTRSDLLNIFGVDEKKVSVVYLGFDALSLGCDSLGTIFKPYILYVGQRGGYKNFENLIRAYASSPWLFNNFNIICFGGGAFEDSERLTYSRLGVKDSQIFYRTGSDVDLGKCYQKASIFVYPSLYEGFGIPLLEAMSLNCPVVCSSVSSIPEVAGSAAEYFDPMDPDSIRYAIELVLNSKERQAELINHGRQRCQFFSWERCAAETSSIYENLNKSK
jgi:glycosyltransferase involved in cell wall biosynthesis